MLINEKVLVIDYNNLASRIIFRIRADANKLGHFIKPYDFMYDTYLRKLWLNDMLGSILKIMSTLLERHTTVIAIDSENPWRKDIYPEYKENRLKQKSKSSEDINWTSVYQLYAEFEKVLENIPAIITLKVKRCEADDIIGTLILNNEERDNLIVSNDGDFKQLAHKASLVDNYHKLFDHTRFTDKEANEVLVKKLILGDSGDNIPNMIRGVGPKTVDSFYEEHGAEGIVHSLVDKYKEKEPLCLQNYKRNKILIDLKKTPNVLQDEIISRYKIAKKSYGRDFEYIIEYAKEHGLNQFTHELVQVKMRLMYG